MLLQVVCEAHTRVILFRRVCLGSWPWKPFSINACKSINAVLNGKVNYKRSNLPQFLDKLKELIDEQVKEVECAVIRCGKYIFQREYQHLEVPDARWFSCLSNNASGIWIKL